MQHRHTDRKQYFDELSITSEQYFVPYVKQFMPVGEGLEVLELGCGDGGNLLPFAKAGCRVTGIDISQAKIEQAQSSFKELGYEGMFLVRNILENPLQGRQYDIIVIHDVIEHISFKEQLLQITLKLIKPGGICFIAFPSWQMPFGGHQQLCRSKMASHWPFLHLLPNKIYKSVLKLCGENDDMVAAMLEIKSSKMTIGNFERLVKKYNWQIADRRLYFINPHYEIKFGLRPRKLSKCISVLPYVRNYFSTSCFYILKAAEN